jgi:hypothetical protein
MLCSTFLATHPQQGWNEGSWALFGGATHNDGAPNRNRLADWTFFNADGSSKNVLGTRTQVTMTRSFS